MWYDKWATENRRMLAGEVWAGLYGIEHVDGMFGGTIDMERLVISMARSQTWRAPNGWVMLMELPGHGVWAGTTQEMPLIYDRGWCWRWWQGGKHIFKPGSLQWSVPWMLWQVRA